AGLGGAEPCRPALTGRASCLDEPVSVGVGLDDGHDLRRGALRQARDVARDRAVVDGDGQCAHGPSAMTTAEAIPASCDSDRWKRVMPSCWARCATVPVMLS